MGPLGTEDLYNLTEFTYLLPVASLASWLLEGNTLSQGLLPQTGALSNTAGNAYILALTVNLSSI